MAKKPAEDQRFQDITLTGFAGLLNIGIVPHLEIGLSRQEVEALILLIRQASMPKASYDDTHNAARVGDTFIRVERMVDENEIAFGDFVTLKCLNDKQWIALFQALKGWVDFLKKNGEESDAEYRVQITPNRAAYRMFQTDDPEEAERLLQENWNNIFQDTGIVLN